MKRISRSLLSLCLALVLCAALLPEWKCGRSDVPPHDCSGENQLYDHGLPTSARRSIYGGDNSVDITLYLIPHGWQ